MISVIFTIICFIPVYLNSFNEFVNFFLTGLFWMNLFQFIFTIIPVTYPKWMGAYSGMKSDGYRILSILKNKAN